MKIALLTDGIWPFVIGGMQKHSFYLCKYLALRGITVELYHSTRDGSVPDLTACFSTAELQYIRSHYIPYPATDGWPGHYIRTSYKYSVSVYSALANSGSCDLIYMKGLAGLKLLEEKNAGKRFPPVFLNVHGYEYYQKAASLKVKLQHLMLRNVFKRANERSDFIFSYGGRITDIIKARIRNGAQKVIELPAGIEPAYLVETASSVHRPRTFVFVGRYERRKGVQELFKALKKLENNVKLEFNFVGPIPRNVGKLGIGTSAVFHGEVRDRAALVSILRNMDVLVCPSYAEGMPNVILEGMASGCAIIGSDVGAIPTEVGNDNGWLVQPGSIDSLANAIKAATNIPDGELNAMRQRSIQKVKDHFLWDNIVFRLVSIFEEILASQNSSLS